MKESLIIMEWITLTISIIGCFTGVWSWGLHIIEFSSKRPKLFCKLDENYVSYWEHGKDIDTQKLPKYVEQAIKVQDVVVLSVEVLNRKNVPVAIEGFFCKNELLFASLNFEDPIFKTGFRDENNKPVYVELITPNENIDLPCKLDAYDVKRFRLVLLMEPSEQKCRKINLTIKTPFKKFDQKFEVYSSKHVALHTSIEKLENAAIDRELNEWKKKS